MDAKFFDRAREEDDFKISIDYHGQWFHDGVPIAREKLAQLFSTALHYDTIKKEYWLITPHEQGRIDVADVPFVIINFEWDNELILTTNLGHAVKPNATTPIYCDGDTPYVTVKNNVSARLNRSVREKLIDIALSQNGYDEDTKTLTLKANGHDPIIARS